MHAVLEATTTLDRNLAVLSRCSRAAADLIRVSPGRADAEFFPTDDRHPSGEPALSATIAGPRGATLLASRRRPLDEAARLAESVPVESAAAVVVIGFGVGHHVAALARRMGRTGVIYVFEPDVGLLRGVLERIDHSAWIDGANVVLFTDPDDTATLSAATRGVEGLIAMGARFVDHPASLPRLAEQGAARFRENVAAAVRAVKTTVVTTLAQSGVTIRNLLMNLDHAATRPGVADLAGVARGRPAIVVSAGPSLRRNVDLLARPGVRDKFLIIAVQTVLKPLLARGIRPHFVTALDYHEISRRFYEGLTAADVEGVTLVAEAKANPAILDAFPGAIRVSGDDFLTDLLGAEVGGRLGQLPPGATVAHMAYYLARHMGADPVMLIGQDLGFTDGQYYAAGAAIHGVWAGELNAFNTLEMMEWQRIVRARPILRRATDVLGRPVYTDEQMTAYLAQFERDFLADEVRGLTIIDATEGGVAKAHTRAVPLAEALARYEPPSVLTLPATPMPADEERRATLRAVAARLREVRREIWRYEQISERTAGQLGEMLAARGDRARVNALIAEVHAARSEVNGLPTARALTERLNQVGVFKRVRADRMLQLAEGLEPVERQRLQIERDIANVSWLAEATASLGGMIDEAVRVLGGAPKVTRDPAAEEESDAPRAPGATANGTAVRVEARPRTVAALIPVDPRRGGLGTARTLGEPLAAGRNPLQWTLARLARCVRLDRVVLLGEDEGELRRLVGTAPAGLAVSYVTTDGAPMGERSRAMRAGRAWGAACWRGGLGTTTVFDEVMCPAVMAGAMERLGLDAAVVLGPDWALVDPALTDALIDRHLESPERHRLAFTQAVPGLAPCVVGRSLMNEFAGALESGGAFASVGGLLGYLPRQPRMRVDPIAGPACVDVAPVVRDAQARLIADGGAGGRGALCAVLEVLGDRAIGASAEEIARLAGAHDAPEPSPHELILELCTGRRTSGLRAAWRPGTAELVERAPMARELAEKLLRELGAARPDGLVTFGGAGDPTLHAELPALVVAAREAGIGAVHVRTDLVQARDRLDALIDGAPDVISVDLMADSPATYRAVMGTDLFGVVAANLEHLLARRMKAGGIPVPWVVPRLTRCDAVYDDVEGFFDRWLTLAGAAVIDPLPEPVPGQRIEPLPRPAGAARRMWSERMLVLCDGRVPASEHDLVGDHTPADAARDGLLPAWRKLIGHRRRIAREHGPGHADLWTGL